MNAVAWERFATKVRPEPNGCWVWTATRIGGGYGSFWLEGKNRPAHIVAYEDARGPVPVGRELDHLCRNRLCVNPDHLEAVDHRTNVLRGQSSAAVAAQRDTCANGHPWTEQNTYRYLKRGRPVRQCRTCGRNRWRARARGET